MFGLTSLLGGASSLLGGGGLGSALGGGNTPSSATSGNSGPTTFGNVTIPGGSGVSGTVLAIGAVVLVAVVGLVFYLKR
jgi:hypothetical protein